MDKVHKPSNSKNKFPVSRSQYRIHKKSQLDFIVDNMNSIHARKQYFRDQL
jgi:hypothetical protein